MTSLCWACTHAMRFVVNSSANWRHDAPMRLLLPRCSSQPTLELVSRILVMRPHRYSARLFTKPANLDNDLSVDSADISDSAIYFVISGKLHFTLHQTECAKFWVFFFRMDPRLAGGKVIVHRGLHSARRYLIGSNERASRVSRN